MTRPSRYRVPFVALTLMGMSFLMVACDLIDSIGIPRAVTITGTLLDDDSTPLANATVWIDVVAGTAGTTATPLGLGVGCPAPGTNAAAWTCTGLDGTFEVEIVTAATELAFTGGDGFRRLRFTFAVPEGLVPGLPETVALGTRFLPELDAVEDLERAITIALPGLTSYALVPFPDDDVVAMLEGAMDGSATDPISVLLPVRDADGTLTTAFPFTAYHHDLRRPEAATCPQVSALQTDPLECIPVEGPSATFQGVPRWGDEQLGNAIAFPEEYRTLVLDGDALREDRFQPSIVSLIDEGPQGTERSVAALYFGPSLAAPSGLQSLRSALETVHGSRLTERLLDLVGTDTYLVYSLADYDVPDEHVNHANGHPVSPPSIGSAGRRSHDGGATPLGHVGIDGPGFSTLVAHMIADPTIYDRRLANPRVQPSWPTRVDHAANLQDLAFTWLQIYVDAPAAQTSLARWSNAFVVRTRIGRYAALSAAAAGTFTIPANACGTSPALIETYAGLSPNAIRDDDLEFWAWWTNTNQYASFDSNGNLLATGTLGCAYVGAMGETGRDGNVSWVHLSFQTLDNTSATFLHETGHLIDGSHATTSTTRASQRCNLLGFIPIGPTGPSLHRARSIGTTRTLCFARTEAGDTTKRNMTRAAEFLHTLLPAAP